MIRLLFQDGKYKDYKDASSVINAIYSLFKKNKNVVKVKKINTPDAILGIKNLGDKIEEEECAKVSVVLERYFFGENADIVKNEEKLKLIK